MKILFYFLFLSALSSGCELSAGEQEITKAQLEQQFAEIQALIDKGSCTGDGECNFLAYGSKSCGGPSGYLIFASNVDKEELKQLVEKYTKSEALYNTKNGILSDCSIVPEPTTLKCAEGNCIEVQP